MQRMKKYKSFLNEGNFIEDFVKDLTGSEEQKDDLLKSNILNFNTQSFFTWLSDKIKREDSQPVYVYNFITSKDPFYVMSEFHEESKAFGFQEDEEGNIVVGSKKYSYCIFNSSKIDSFSENFLTSDLNKILSKNSEDYKNTIIEVTNFSSLDDESKKFFNDIIERREIGDYKLKQGEFFIFSDNTNSRKGGKDLSSSLGAIFPNTKFYIIGHKFSLTEENPE
jgi:hypothetical protein